MTASTFDAALEARELTEAELAAEHALQARNARFKHRAELLGTPVDPSLDEADWLAAHRALAHRYLVLAHPQALVELPLAIDTYPGESAEDVAMALAEVLDQDPVESSEITRLYEPVEKPAELPASAPAVFALCGKPQTGKDVVADYIQANYRSVARFAFSDAIVDEVNAYLAPFGHLIDESNKSAPQYRHLLQAWGMARRVEDEHHWTKQVDRKVRRAWDEGARMVIVTGARMPSDVQVIKETLGGEVWKVVRPGNTYKAAHAVEAGLDHLPDSEFRVISNDVEGDLEPYEANIEAALRAPREIPVG